MKGTIENFPKVSIKRIKEDYLYWFILFIVAVVFTPARGGAQKTLFIYKGF